jgi:branched-chain amino acid aminotransferase
MHEPLADLPEGVYSGLRTFPGGRFLELEAHLARAERSARAMGYSVSDEREGLLDALQQVADEAAPVDLALRFDVLAEAAALDGVAARAWIAAAPLQPLPEPFLEQGVAVQWARDLMRDRPLVKTTSFVLRRRPYPLGRQEAFEHLLLDPQRRILEGTSSSFFVVCDDCLLTAGGGVLEGITRAIVLRLADRLGLRARLEAPAAEDVGHWSEAFLTSSTRAVVPVIEVAGERVADGRPGPWTRRLRESYAACAEREARRARDAAPTRARS